MDKNKLIAKIIGEPFSLSTKGLKLSKKIQECEYSICNLFFEFMNSDLRYKNGELTILKKDK